jgi:hypothetical protein
MDNQKDVGLENVEIKDFTSETHTTDATRTVEKKSAEAKLEGIQSFAWGSVSHVMIGPNGISLVPTGTTEKFSVPQNKTYTYPTPGQAPTMFEYDIGTLYGSVYAVSALESEKANFTKEIASLKTELASTRAELEKVTKEFAAQSTLKAEVVKPASAVMVNPMSPPPGPLPPGEPQGVAGNGDEENARLHFNISQADWDAMNQEAKNKLVDQYIRETMEKSKEAIAKAEQAEAVVKGSVTTPQKGADHSESNLETAMRLMQAAKKKNLL